MDMNELSGLRMTYIGQSIADGTGVGGSARLKNMVSIFRRLAIRIDMISFSFYSDSFKIETTIIDDSLQITMIHIPGNLNRLVKAFAIFPVFIYGISSSKKSDIIFSDFITEIAYLPAVLLGFIFHKPVILDYIDTKFFKFIPHSINKFAAQRADLIFAISHYLEDFCKTEYKCKKVIYLPIFIDTDLFKMDLKLRNEMREKLRIKENEIVIGYAGAFASWEGLPILLKAFKSLSEKYTNIKMAIMGKVYAIGDESIEKLVNDIGLSSDKMILIPSQPYESVPYFLSAFDILCCPKLDCEINRAANPIKVVEYLSMGLPSVCSSVGGILDTIQDKHDGLLVKPGDALDLEQKLEWIILNPDKAKKLGKCGREKAIRYYSLEAIEGLIRTALYDICNNQTE